MLNKSTSSTDAAPPPRLCAVLPHCCCDKEVILGPAAPLTPTLLPPPAPFVAVGSGTLSLLTTEEGANRQSDFRISGKDVEGVGESKALMSTRSK
jgi:hypothetical protein